MFSKEQSQNSFGLVDSYLTKNHERYTSKSFQYNPTNLGLKTSVQCDILAPKTEDQNMYRLPIARAIKRNVEFFGSWPIQNFRVSLLETTADWNHFFSETDFQKKRGDQRAGFAVKNTVVFFTRKGLQEETNLLKEEENPDEMIEILATHEAGHMVVEELSPRFNQRKWVKEGTAFTLVNKPPYADWKKELHKHLITSGYSQEKPDDDILYAGTYIDSTGRKNHLDRRFGYAYIQYALSVCKLSSQELMRQFFEEVNKGGKIETVISRLTKRDEKEFYHEFLNSLESR